MGRLTDGAGRLASVVANTSGSKFERKCSQIRKKEETTTLARLAISHGERASLVLVAPNARENDNNNGQCRCHPRLKGRRDEMDFETK